MDNNSEQLELKKILVDLEDEHKHLQVSIGHLQNEIKKREVEIQKLVSERELELARDSTSYKQLTRTRNTVEHQVPEKRLDIEYSSYFAKQVGQLLEDLTKKSEQVSALIKL